MSFKSCAEIQKDLLSLHGIFNGTLSENNLFNLGIEEDFRKALKNMGVNLDSIYEQEPDAGLGKRRFRSLGSMLLDGLATDGYPANGIFFTL